MSKYRVEEKYYIDQATYSVIHQRLKELVLRDPHAGEEGEYRVDSIYFDDYLNSAYEDKLAGVDKRFKLRIRAYNLDPQSIKLERKTKSNNFVKKDTQSLSLDDYQGVLNGNLINFSGKPLLNQLGIMQRSVFLHPVCIVTYNREAFTVGKTSIRITFDKQLRTRLSTTDLFKDTNNDSLVFHDDTMIMEVKYDSYLPAFLKGILQVGHLRKQSISKYVLCVEQKRKILFRS